MFQHLFETNWFKHTANCDGKFKLDKGAEQIVFKLHEEMMSFKSREQPGVK